MDMRTFLVEVRRGQFEPVHADWLEVEDGALVFSSNSTGTVKIYAARAWYSVFAGDK